MNHEFLEILIKLVITALGAVITYIVVPWIKNRIDADKLDKLQSYTEFAIRYAEQKYSNSENMEKKRYVYDYILNKSAQIGLNLTDSDIDVIVEGCVNLIKHGEVLN